VAVTTQNSPASGPPSVPVSRLPATSQHRIPTRCPDAFFINSPSPLLRVLRSPPRLRVLISPTTVPSPQSPVPPPPSSSPTLRLPLRSKDLTLRYPTSKSRIVRTKLQTTRPTRTILKDYFIPRIPAPNPSGPVSHDTFVRTDEDSTRECRGPHCFGPSQSRRPSSTAKLVR
jgi:hypothetical protein